MTVGATIRMIRRDELQGLTPSLRRYAFGLTGDAEAADDLTRDVALAALRSRGMGRGAAFRRRVYAILTDFNRLRAATGGRNAHGGAWDGDPLAAMSLAEREAILLVAVEDFSYADAADILDVAVPALIARLAGARTPRVAAGDPVRLRVVS